MGLDPVVVAHIQLHGFGIQGKAHGIAVHFLGVLDVSVGIDTAAGQLDDLIGREQRTLGVVGLYAEHRLAGLAQVGIRGSAVSLPDLAAGPELSVEAHVAAAPQIEIALLGGSDVEGSDRTIRQGSEGLQVDLIRVSGQTGVGVAADILRLFPAGQLAGQLVPGDGRAVGLLGKDQQQKPQDGHGQQGREEDRFGRVSGLPAAGGLAEAQSEHHKNRRQQGKQRRMRIKQNKAGGNAQQQHEAHGSGPLPKPDGQRADVGLQHRQAHQRGTDVLRARLLLGQIIPDQVVAPGEDGAQGAPKVAKAFHKLRPEQPGQKQQQAQNAKRVEFADLAVEEQAERQSQDRDQNQDRGGHRQAEGRGQAVQRAQNARADQNPFQQQAQEKGVPLHDPPPPFRPRGQIQSAWMDSGLGRSAELSGARQAARRTAIRSSSELMYCSRSSSPSIQTA